MLNGCSQVNVTKDLKIHQISVRYIFQKYLTTGEVTDAKRIDRPWQKTKKQRWLVCKTSRNNTFFTAREVRTAAGDVSEVSLTQ